MVLSVSYAELNKFISKKTNRDIDVSFVGPNKLSIAYMVAVRLPIAGEISKRIEVGVILESLEGTKCSIVIDTNVITGFFLEHFHQYILKLPKGLVTLFENRRAIIDLTAIPEARLILSYVKVEDLAIKSTGIEVFASL